VFDGRRPKQAILVTGSARLDAFRQAGESLAGRYFAWHLNPVTIPEFMVATSSTAEDALSFGSPSSAGRWPWCPQPTGWPIFELSDFQLENCSSKLEALYFR
jgi:predicted AAA+ superfamily ATPase